MLQSSYNENIKISFTAPYIPIAKTRGFTEQSDKALGLDVCTSDNDEYVTISVNWYPKAAERPNKREIDIFVIYAETYGDDFDMELEMDDAEYATVLADFKKKFKDTFGKSLEDIWNEESEEE